MRTRGIPLALVTSASRRCAHGLLRELGLLDVFARSVSGEDVARGKPTLRATWLPGYLATCEAVGLDRAQVVGFEDSRAGVAAVKSAGMGCVAVATTQSPEVLDAADVVIADFEELAHILHAACTIVDDPSILVIGSQSMLATFDEDELPDAATASMGVDLGYFDDPAEDKADAVDGAIGELSPIPRDERCVRTRGQGANRGAPGGLAWPCGTGCDWDRPGTARRRLPGRLLSSRRHA